MGPKKTPTEQLPATTTATKTTPTVKKTTKPKKEGDKKTRKICFPMESTSIWE